MKNLILASVLGSAAAGLVVPALAGPVHFAITRPYSLFGWIPPAQANQPATVTLGTAPLDFVLTDVSMGRGASNYENVFVTVNGVSVFNFPVTANAGVGMPFNMSSGIFVPAGSSIGVQVPASAAGNSISVPVTLVGYVQ
jgi:hypothetical protein